MSHGRVLERTAHPDAATPMALAARRLTDRAFAQQDGARRRLIDEARQLIDDRPGQVGVWIRQIERGRARAQPS